jgi:hypothetical protein
MIILRGETLLTFFTHLSAGFDIQILHRVNHFDSHFNPGPSQDRTNPSPSHLKPMKS